MLHDGFWQKDLVPLSNKIIYWQRRINRLFDNGYGYTDKNVAHARHELTRALFFSACIVRKIIEEEFEAVDAIRLHNKIFTDEEIKVEKEHYMLHNQQIQIYCLPLKDESINCFDDYCHEDYDYHSVKKELHSIKHISNWLIHSYVWELGCLKENNKHIDGFIISSDYDKTKASYFVELTSWNKIINLCVQNAYL